MTRLHTSYTWHYHTPDGMDDLLLSCEDDVLTGIAFEVHSVAAEHVEMRPIFRETVSWLDAYFAGWATAENLPRYKIENLTPFRQAVIHEMLKIPFGETRTYGEIGKRIAAARGVEKMSAQAVGGAVGWNPLCILIPCHRVVGAGGALVGYHGGLPNKMALLAHEKRILSVRRNK